MLITAHTSVQTAVDVCKSSTCGEVVFRTLDSQSREPGFKSSCCRFEA